jgi:hypothetical protein
MPTAASQLNVSISIHKKERTFTATLTAKSGACIVVSASSPAQLKDGIGLLYDVLEGVCDEATAQGAMQHIWEEVEATLNQEQSTKN